MNSGVHSEPCGLSALITAPAARPAERSAPRYEPIIVATLRRYLRRGASPGLLRRLAGGARDWRLLNDWWNVDGRGAGLQVGKPDRPALELGDPIPGLSVGERRLVLLQIAEECDELGARFPGSVALAVYFDVSRHQVDNDLQVLRDMGRLAWHPSQGEAGAWRVVDGGGIAP